MNDYLFLYDLLLVEFASLILDSKGLAHINSGRFRVLLDSSFSFADGHCGYRLDSLIKFKQSRLLILYSPDDAGNIQCVADLTSAIFKHLDVSLHTSAA